MPLDRRRLAAGGLATMGVLHLVVPRSFERVVPAWLPARRLLVYLSGAAELASAAGLATAADWAPALAAATLAGVWPANIDMAVQATRAGRSAVWQGLLWARVPLQVPMVRAVLAMRPAVPPVPPSP